MIQLGGARASTWPAQEIGLGTRESVPDVARNLSRWVDGIAARVFAHATLIGARAGTPPSRSSTGCPTSSTPARRWPTSSRCGSAGVDLARLRLAWVGDGNNVCHSLLLLGAAARRRHASWRARPATSRIPQVIAQARARSAAA